MKVEELKKQLGTEFSFIFDIINPILQYLNIPKSAKILDVGTGNGRMAITLAFNGYNVITGEPENDNSEYAKRDWLNNAMKVKLDHLIDFQPLIAEKMPFEDNSFDVIFIFGSFHHINEKDRPLAIKECVRVSKLNGFFCIFEPGRRGIKMIKQRIPSHPDAADPRKYIEDIPLSLEVKRNPFFNAFIFRKQ